MLRQTTTKLLFVLVGLITLGLLILFPQTSSANAPATINFQGKIVNSNGTNVPDGTYSIVFRLYNTPSPTMTTSCTTTASCAWEETQASVSVTSGVFQVELGSVCALTSTSCNNSSFLGGINFSNNNSLYLTLQFSGDTSGSNGGFMSPLIHMTSVPYAFWADNAGALSGLSASKFVQLAPSSTTQTDSDPLFPSIGINKTVGGVNIMQLQKSGSDVFVVGNTGATTITNTSAAALNVQGAASVLKVDSTNSITNVQGINSAAAAGSELIDVGSATTCSGTNWSGSGHGPYTHTTGSATSLACSPPASVTNNAYYQVEFNTGSVTAGSLTLQVGGASATSAPVDSNVTNQFEVVQAGGTGAISFSPTSNFAGTLTIQSIKLITLSNAVIAINNSDGTTGINIRSGGGALKNTFVGLNSGQTNTTGTDNSSLGNGALSVNTTGFDNTAVGFSSLSSNSTGNQNTGVGSGSLTGNTSGVGNTAVGYWSLLSATTANNNTAVGNSALSSTTSGGSNTAVGSLAGNNNTTGTNNTFLGANAGYQDPNVTNFATLTNLQNATAIGYGAEAQQNNSIVLGGVGTTAANLTPNVGIGTTAPTNVFSVSPNIYDTGTASVTSGTTAVSSSGATWSSNFAGMEIIFADGKKYTIASATSTTITLSSNATATESSSKYRIHNPAFFVSSTGQTQVRTSTNSTSAFQVQNAAGTSLFAVDTTNSKLSIGAGTLQRVASGATTIDLSDTSATTLNISNSGAGNITLALDSGGSFAVGASTGVSLGTCTGSQVVTGFQSVGGIVTGGSCAGLSSSTTLTQTYNNGSLAADQTILLTTGHGGGIIVRDNATTVGKAFQVQTSATTSLLDVDTQNVTVNLGVTGTTATASSVNIANSSGAVAQTVSIGSLQSTSATTIQAGSGNLTLSTQAGADVNYAEGAGSSLNVTASAATSIDQVTISNASGATSTTGVDGLSINFNTTGSTASADNSGLRVDVTSGNSGATTTLEGLKISNLVGAQANSTETGLYVGTGWDVGLDLQSGGIQLAAMSNPTTPTSGNLRVYAKLVAGRTMLKALSSTGIDYVYQPSLFQQSVFLATPGAGTAVTPSALGGQVTNSVGTATMAATTEAQGFMGNYLSGTTAGTGAGVSNATLQYYRGSGGNNADGFFFFTRLNFPDAIASYNNTTTGSRFFAGLSDQVIAGSGMEGSDTPTGNYIGFSYAPTRDATNFHIISRDGTTANTATSTGVALTVAKTYDMYIYCSYACTSINWRIDNLTDGTAPVEGTYSSNLPTATVAMRAGFGLAPLSTTAHNIRWQRIYVETDR